MRSNAERDYGRSTVLGAVGRSHVTACNCSVISRRRCRRPTLISVIAGIRPRNAIRQARRVCERRRRWCVGERCRRRRRCASVCLCLPVCLCATTEKSPPRPPATRAIEPAPSKSIKVLAPVVSTRQPTTLSSIKSHLPPSIRSDLLQGTPRGSTNKLPDLPSIPSHWLP